MYRSRRYLALVEGHNRDTIYSVPDAVGKIKATPKKCKFDETIDLAIKLDIDTSMANQMVRGSFSLPNGTGKSLRVVAFCTGPDADAARAAGAVEVGGEDLVKKVNDGWLEFDVAVAHPSMMRFVGRLGKVLGPKGLMPSPKSGSVTNDVAKAVKEFKGGKIEYRHDKIGNMNVIVGKMSFGQDKLVENIDAFLRHLVSVRPAAVKGTFLQRITVSSTMGPGYRLAPHQAAV
ncbi:MAG TPA: 50S ribosomal protein L1 [Planctomycetota bacterium]|nr:50S ribosomal protein L1 [Planctomycetota bacterium]